jgi:hypothetical protein
MGTNGFREDELVSRRVKVGNDWQIKVFPVVGGRLICHPESVTTKKSWHHVGTLAQAGCQT